jgi:hypothetical protein
LALIEKKRLSDKSILARRLLYENYGETPQAAGP